MTIAAKALVDRFGLLPHPEGGFYKETYRSKEDMPRFGGRRSVCTGIYFLLTEGTKSRLHRIKSDEMWHFYAGGPLELVQIFPDGTVEAVVLGQDVLAGEKVQHVVPAGAWFGAAPRSGYSFVGCTVAPGFDFADFEMAKREELLRAFPEAKAAIERLTDA